MLDTENAESTVTQYEGKTDQEILAEVSNEAKEVIPESASEPEHEVEEAEPRYTDVELRAMAQGWKPKDKFAESDKSYISAEEFIKRGELYDTISHQKRENRKLQESIKEILELNKRQAELALKDRVKYFSLQRNAAIESGNKAEFDKFDTEYNESKKELDLLNRKEAQPSHPVDSKDVNPVVVDFVKRNNSWFNDFSSENKQMKDFAIRKEVYLRQQHPDWSDERCIYETERSVKDLFPHRFENTNRQRRQSVGIPVAENNVNTKQVKFNQLPRDIQAAIRPWAEQCGLSLDEYANQLINGGLIDVK